MADTASADRGGFRGGFGGRGRGRGRGDRGRGRGRGGRGPPDGLIDALLDANAVVEWFVEASIWKIEGSNKRLALGFVILDCGQRHRMTNFFAEFCIH